MAQNTAYHNAVRREMQERAAATASASPGIRNIHNVLADLHAGIAWNDRANNNEGAL